MLCVPIGGDGSIRSWANCAVWIWISSLRGINSRVMPSGAGALTAAILVAFRRRQTAPARRDRVSYCCGR